MSAAFTAEQRSMLLTSRCTDNGNDKADTLDKVFLLSVREIEVHTHPGEGTAGMVRRRTAGTDFARARKPDGGRLYVYDKGLERDYVVVEGQRRGCSWWWTRSQLQDQHPERATFIGARSNIKRYGKVDLFGVGVRPALRLPAGQPVRPSPE